MEFKMQIYALNGETRLFLQEKNRFNIALTEKIN
jgi:hypothetical protein